MSTSDHILLRTRLTVPEAAQCIADALGLELTTNRPPGTLVVSGPVPGRQSISGGRVTINHLGNEPGEPSILDYYDVMWVIRCTDKNPDVVHSESLRLFALVTEKLPWPAMLYRDLTWLVAVWSPTHGRHDFPEGVSPHTEDQHIWEPYVPTRW